MEDCRKLQKEIWDGLLKMNQTIPLRAVDIKGKMTPFEGGVHLEYEVTYLAGEAEGMEAATNGGAAIPETSKPKSVRNISAEERERRRQRMLDMWAERRKAEGTE